MSRDPKTIYSRYVAFKATEDLANRLDHFSRALGRRRSDVLRFMLGQLLNAYAADSEAIQKIKEQMH